MSSGPRTQTDKPMPLKAEAVVNKQQELYREIEMSSLGSDDLDGFTVIKDQDYTPGREDENMR